MGCGNPKEKIEDEIIKAKFERTIIQNERMNQIKLLEKIYGHPVKRTNIPDYIAPQFQETKRKNEISPVNGKRLPIRIKSRRAKSFVLKRKKRLNEENTTIRRNKTMKRKSYIYKENNLFIYIFYILKNNNNYFICENLGDLLFKI